MRSTALGGLIVDAAGYEMVRVDAERLGSDSVAPFAIGAVEVTQELWGVVMRTEPSDCSVGCDSDKPVNRVSWEAAIRFANALSRLEGRREYYRIHEDGSIEARHLSDGYRLPTSEEWRLAAGAGSGLPFAGASSPEEVCRIGNVRNPEHGDALDFEPFPCVDPHRTLAPIRSFTPNAWGIHDMTGNVAEWVFDPYDGSDARVFRGGSFRSSVARTRLDHRNYAAETFERSDVGLRLARSLR